MPEDQIPIQPVENPILCSPYKEPDQHWLYGTRTDKSGMICLW